MKKAMIFATLAIFSAGNVGAGEWITLFSGKDIEGWEKKGGQATYTVEDGCIVGTTKPKTPNTFLCPPKKDGDFELIFDVKCDPALNSGVQIRSISNADEVPDGLSEKNAAKAKQGDRGPYRSRLSPGSRTMNQSGLAAATTWFHRALVLPPAL